MVTYRGYKTNIQYAAETSYGAGASFPGTAIGGKVRSFSISQNNNLIRTQGLGEGRNETFVGFGNYSCSWNGEYEIGDFAFLEFGIGTKAGSGTAAQPYYLTEGDFRTYTGTGLKTCAIEVAGKDVTGGTDQVDTLTGCVINNISINLNVGEVLTCSIDGFAKTVTSGTSSSTFSASSAKPWIFALGNFKWNGSNIGRVTNMTINISNNYDEDVGRELGSRFVAEMEPGLRKYEWSATMKMTSSIVTTLLSDFYGVGLAVAPVTGSGTPAYKEIILDLSEGVATGERKAQIKLSNCAINDITKTINIGDNVIEVSMNGTAMKGTVETIAKPFKWWTI